jgi:hypothetical protein
MHTVFGIYDGEAIRPSEAVRARPNTTVLITFLDDDAQPVPFAPTRLENVAGCLPYTGPAKTLEEMHAAIRDHAKQQWR